MKGKILDSYREELLTLEPDMYYCFGRERAATGGGLQIEDIFVSRKHATIGFDGRYHITDEGSRNGTFVNGERLLPGERFYLKNGDRLKLADREYEFAEAEEPLPAEAGPVAAQGAGQGSDRAFGFGNPRADRAFGFGNPGADGASGFGNPGAGGASGYGAAGPGEGFDKGVKGAAGGVAATDSSKDSDDASGVAEEESDRGEWGPFVYSLRSSAAGRRLSVETEKKGCVDYQVRMIEENPGLMIGEVIHVRNLDNDCFLCEVGGRFSLKDYVTKQKHAVDGIELIDRILKLVKLGEEHMLDRDKYFLTPSTVFVDKNGDLMLIYIPHMGKKDRCFSNGMAELCTLLTGICPDQQAGLASMERVFRENVCDTREYIKHVYHYKLIDFPGPGAVSKEKERGRLPVRYVITVLSFVLFMAVFWLTNLNTINLAGIFLILAGGNTLLYTIKREGGKLKASI